MLLLRENSISSTRRYCAALLIALIVSIPTQLRGQELLSDIDEAEKMWANAWTNGDKETYRELLADEFTWTYITGKVIDKDQAVDALNRFTIPENTKTINEYGNTAVVYGTASLDFRGRPITERFVRIWVKNEAGRWQVVLFQATEIQ